MKNQQKQILTGTHGHMVKTKRQIIEDLKLIDIVVEILDARIPISSQNPDIGNYIKVVNLFNFDRAYEYVSTI